MRAEKNIRRPKGEISHAKRKRQSVGRSVAHKFKYYHQRFCLFVCFRSFGRLLGESPISSRRQNQTKSQKKKQTKQKRTTYLVDVDVVALAVVALVVVAVAVVALVVAVVVVLVKGLY